VNRMPKPQNQHTLNSEMDQIPLNARNKLQEGLAFHQKGKLQQAEQAYQQALQYHPQNADAYHLLGVIAYQTVGNSTNIDGSMKNSLLNTESSLNLPGMDQICLEKLF
jgi:Tfp pilus assembly protein PilF